MEETVIWEQHTVTLHRVSFWDPPSDALCTLLNPGLAPDICLSTCLSYFLLPYLTVFSTALSLSEVCSV